jgi:nitroreductase
VPQKGFSFLDLVKKRRSVRKFQDKKVDRELLTTCVEAARLAPSAENVEPWRFLIIDDPEAKENLCRHAFTGIFSATRWAAKAPVIIVLLSELEILANRIGRQITGLNYYLIDMGIAGEHFVLQAQELGLGTCWIGWFSGRGVRKALKLPRKYRPIGLLALGYPDVPAVKEKKRRSLNEICWFNEVK